MFRERPREGLHSLPFFLPACGADVVGINLRPNTFGETCKSYSIKEAELFYVCAGANIERRYLSAREALSHNKKEPFFGVLRCIVSLCVDLQQDGTTTTRHNDLRRPTASQHLWRFNGVTERLFM